MIQTQAVWFQGSPFTNLLCHFTKKGPHGGEGGPQEHGMWSGQLCLMVNASRYVPPGHGTVMPNGECIHVGATWLQGHVW